MNLGSRIGTRQPSHWPRGETTSGYCKGGGVKLVGLRLYVHNMPHLRMASPREMRKQSEDLVEIAGPN